MKANKDLKTEANRRWTPIYTDKIPLLRSARETLAIFRAWTVRLFTDPAEKMSVLQKSTMAAFNGLESKPILICVHLRLSAVRF